MSVASPTDVAVNPNNPEQRYILWGTGRVDAIGGAPTATGTPPFWDRLDQPICMAIHVTDWTTGSGYILDYHGQAHSFGDAPDIMVDHDGNPDTYVQLLGIPFATNRQYVDWSWNPDGSPQGYILTAYGELLPFGGATAPPRTGPRLSSPIAKKLAMRWTPDKRAITLDMFGDLYGDFATTFIPVPSHHATFDAMRDVVVTDWTTGGGVSGYTLDLYGGMHSFGAAPQAWGYPYSQGGDLARVLAVISASDPARFWQVWSGGQSFDYLSSTAPTVTAGGDGPSPAPLVTTTTRPDLRWSYSDPQSDSQTGWQVLVFTQAFVASHDMSDPLAWTASAVVAREGTDPRARGIACPVDLADGDYRLFVRAKDSAQQWSAWDDHAWTQDVPAPTTPTGLTAVANQTTFSVVLSVAADAMGVADVVLFEASDDGGLTWAPVRGADAVTLISTTTAVDRDIPLGVIRTYRAVAYSADPRVASDPSNTATATISRLVYVLTAVDDPDLGGEVPAIDPSGWSRPISAGIFEGLGDEYATVLDDGRPKSRRMTLHLNTHNRAEWQLVAGLAESGSMLVYRDPFGEVVYCKPAGGDWNRTQLPAARLAGEVTPLRHMHTTSLPLVEVRPPHLGP